MDLIPLAMCVLLKFMFCVTELNFKVCQVSHFHEFQTRHMQLKQGREIAFARLHFGNIGVLILLMEFLYPYKEEYERFILLLLCSITF